MAFEISYRRVEMQGLFKFSPYARANIAGEIYIKCSLVYEFMEMIDILTI